MHYAIGPLFYRENTLKHKGDRIQGHSHTFDHNTRCKEGKIRLVKKILIKNDDDSFTEKEFSTILTPLDRDVLVEKEISHQIIAEEDNSTYVCVYPHRTFDGSIVEKYTGWPEAYS